MCAYRDDVAFFWFHLFIIRLNGFRVQAYTFDVRPLQTSILWLQGIFAHKHSQRERERKRALDSAAKSRKNNDKMLSYAYRTKNQNTEKLVIKWKMVNDATTQNIFFSLQKYIHRVISGGSFPFFLHFPFCFALVSFSGCTKFYMMPYHVKTSLEVLWRFLSDYPHLCIWQCFFLLILFCHFFISIFPSKPFLQMVNRPISMCYAVFDSCKQPPKS